MTKLEIEKYIKGEIKALEKCEADPNISEVLRAYWRGQWDALAFLAAHMDIKVKRRGLTKRKK